MTAEQEIEPPRRRKLTITRILIVWLVAVAAFFAWQAAEYQGLVAWFAEWQYDRFGGYFPLASILLLVLVFGAPVLYALSARAQRENGGIVTPWSQARALFRFLTWVALSMGVASLVALLLGVFSTMGSGAPVQIDVASAQGTVPDNGPATLKGRILHDRVATMGADTPFGGWDIRFAPVVSERGGQIRYFVQTRDPVGEAESGSVTGALRRNGLRGDLIPLFRDAGYNVASPHYVLFTDAAAMRVPYFWAAFQCALVSLVFGLAAWFQVRRARKLKPPSQDRTQPAV